jgi:hypothetical protein
MPVRWTRGILDISNSESGRTAFTLHDVGLKEESAKEAATGTYVRDWTLSTTHYLRITSSTSLLRRTYSCHHACKACCCQ